MAKELFQPQKISAGNKAKLREFGVSIRPSQWKKQNLAVKLENGQVVSWLRVRKDLLERLEWLGFSHAQKRAKLLEARIELEKLSRAVDLRGQGLDWKEIGERIGTTPKTATRWVKGTRQPMAISLSRSEGYSRHRKPAYVNPGQHPEFAYLLGIFAARPFIFLHGDAERHIKLSTLDVDEASEFARCLEKFDATAKSFSEKPAPARGRRSQRTTESISSNLVRLINKATKYGTAVPPAFLETQETRLAFLKGVFDRAGYVKSVGRGRPPVLGAHLPNQTIAKRVSDCLDEYRIEHSLRSPLGAPSRITIRSSSREYFMEKIGFTSRVKRARAGRRK